MTVSSGSFASTQNGRVTVPLHDIFALYDIETTKGNKLRLCNSLANDLASNDIKELISSSRPDIDEMAKTIKNRISKTLDSPRERLDVHIEETDALLDRAILASENPDATDFLRSNDFQAAASFEPALEGICEDLSARMKEYNQLWKESRKQAKALGDEYLARAENALGGENIELPTMSEQTNTNDKKSLPETNSHSSTQQGFQKKKAPPGLG